MNIRFSDRSVRCRVSRAELDRLLSGRAVILEVPLPRAHVFRGNIWPGAIGGWQLESDPTGIWITIPKSELQQLADSLPSREGIEHAFDVEEGTVTVSFEVDVRDRSAKTAAGDAAQNAHAPESDVIAADVDSVANVESGSPQPTPNDETLTSRTTV